MKVEVETVQAELTLFGAENAVFTDPASVLYLSGYNDPADVGFPYVGLPAAVVVGACDSVLLVPSVCKSAAEGTGVALILYEVYDYRRHVDLLRSFTAGLVEALDLAGAMAGRLGYEPLRGPAAVTSTIELIRRVALILITLALMGLRASSISVSPSVYGF